MNEDRMVCRNELGHVRLMPGVNIVINGRNRRVAAARIACADKFEEGEA